MIVLKLKVSGEIVRDILPFGEDFRYDAAIRNDR